METESGYSLLGYEINAYRLVRPVTILLFSVSNDKFTREYMLTMAHQQTKDRDVVDQFHCPQIVRRETPVYKLSSFIINLLFPFACDWSKRVTH